MFIFLCEFLGEALGGLKSSAQHMKLDIARLKKNLISIESEATVVLKEANQMNAQHMVWIKVFVIILSSL